MKPNLKNNTTNYIENWLNEFGDQEVMAEVKTEVEKLNRKNMMNKALYERVIIEPLIPKTDNDSGVEGLTPEDELVEVKVHDWGTMVDGSAFPYPVGSIAYIKQGANLIVISKEKNLYLVDRRLILGIQ
jgi:hypothetical protein